MKINSATPSSSDSPITTYLPIISHPTLEKLQTLSDGFYLGDPNITTHATWYIGMEQEGNILISSIHDHPTEFILHGAFEIDKRDFCFGPEGNYYPNNAYGAKLADAKATCRLLPIHDPKFKFSVDDFPTIISNIQKLESIAPVLKGDIISSCIYTSQDGSSPSFNSIRITHSLFEVSILAHLQ